MKALTLAWLAETGPDATLAVRADTGRRPAAAWPEFLAASPMATGESGADADARTAVDPDVHWVRRCRDGDAAAFETLVRHHQRMIHSLAFRLTGSAADAEDLAQETFLRAYEQLGSFRQDAKFSTWLYRIALNLCLNWRQDAARRSRLELECAGELAVRQTAHARPDHPLTARLQGALLRLPPRQRAALVLTLCDGLNHAEVAEILGCAETTVSWRVFSARRKLQRWLSTPGDAS